MLPFSQNPTLDDSAFAITPTLSDSFILPITIHRNYVYHALLSLYLQKVYGSGGVPPIVRKYASLFAPCLVKPFELCRSTSTLSFAGGLSTFSLFL